MDNASPNTSDDEDGRKEITLFSKSPVSLSYKCPVISSKQEKGKLEYGFYHGNIEIENPVEDVCVSVSQSLIKTLEQSEKPYTIIRKLLREHANASKTPTTI